MRRIISMSFMDDLLINELWWFFIASNWNFFSDLFFSTLKLYFSLTTRLTSLPALNVAQDFNFFYYFIIWNLCDSLDWNYWFSFFIFYLYRLPNGYVLLSIYCYAGVLGSIFLIIHPNFSTFCSMDCDR